MILQLGVDAIVAIQLLPQKVALLLNGVAIVVDVALFREFDVGQSFFE